MRNIYAKSQYAKIKWDGAEEPTIYNSIKLIDINRKY